MRKLYVKVVFDWGVLFLRCRQIQPHIHPVQSGPVFIFRRTQMRKSKAQIKSRRVLTRVDFDLGYLGVLEKFTQTIPGEHRA